MSLDADLEQMFRRVVREELAAALTGGVPSPGVELLTYDQAAKVGGLQKATIKKWVSSGRLKAVGSRRSRRIRLEDLRAALELDSAPSDQAKRILSSVGRGNG
jgi:excisionase family DNA binding protein